MADIRIKRTSRTYDQMPQSNGEGPKLKPGELALAKDTIWYGPYEDSNTTDQGTAPIAIASITYVNEKINDTITAAAEYKGVVNSSTDIKNNVGKGDFYRVGTSFTFANTTLHPQDILIAEVANPTNTISEAGWAIIHGEAVGVESVTQGNNGIVIGGTTSNPTIGHKIITLDNLSKSNRTYVNSLTFDSYGHIIAYDIGTENVTNTWRPIEITREDGTVSVKTGVTNSGALQFGNGINSSWYVENGLLKVNVSATNQNANSIKIPIGGTTGKQWSACSTESDKKYGAYKLTITGADTSFVNINYVTEVVESVSDGLINAACTVLRVDNSGNVVFYAAKPIVGYIIFTSGGSGGSGDSGSGGGHTIQDSQGYPLTQTTTMRFTNGLTAENDSNNTITTVKLQAATNTTLGGIKCQSINATISPLVETATAERNYAVRLDGSQQAFVTVPWINSSWYPNKKTGTVFLLGSQGANGSPAASLSDDPLTTSTSIYYISDTGCLHATKFEGTIDGGTWA